MQTTTITYIGAPSIPAGMTVSDYRRSRPTQTSARRRLRRLVRL